MQLPKISYRFGSSVNGPGVDLLFIAHGSTFSSALAPRTVSWRSGVPVSKLGVNKLVFAGFMHQASTEQLKHYRMLADSHTHCCAL